MRNWRNYEYSTISIDERNPNVQGVSVRSARAGGVCTKTLRFKASGCLWLGLYSHSAVSVASKTRELIAAKLLFTGIWTDTPK